MTKLEREMMGVISDYGFPEDNAKAAAEVAKKYIEKAYDDAIYHWLFVEDQYKTSSTRKAAWLKENGITE